MGIDPNSLPRDSETLRKIVVDLVEQLDRSLAEQSKYQSLLRELLEAQRNRKSEQLSKEQLALFEAAWQARSVEAESAAERVPAHSITRLSELLPHNWQPTTCSVQARAAKSAAASGFSAGATLNHETLTVRFFIAGLSGAQRESLKSAAAA